MSDLKRQAAVIVAQIIHEGLMQPTEEQRKQMFDKIYERLQKVEKK